MKNFWLWDVKSLQLALKQNAPINEYLYCIFAFIIFCFLPCLDRPESLQLIFLSSETLIGITILYRMYEGKNFIKKIICLSLPIFLRLFLIAIILAVIVTFVFSDYKNEYHIYSQHFYNILGFILLGNYLKST